MTRGTNNTAEHAVRAQRQEYAFDVGKTANEEEVPNFGLAGQGKEMLKFEDLTGNWKKCRLTMRTRRRSSLRSTSLALSVSIPIASKSVKSLASALRVLTFFPSLSVVRLMCAEIRSFRSSI